MTTVIVLFLAFGFGAGDQYLGNFSAHPWMADVSLLSAPWLVIAFAAGATQRDPKRAALIGTAATFAALIGYMLMTLSPIENAHLTLTSVGGFLVSSQRVFLGGLVTGPLFGWLGHRWRVRGSRAAGLVTAAALCLEPLAQAAAGSPIGSRAVLVAEVVLGAACLAVATRRTGASSTGSAVAS